MRTSLLLAAVLALQPQPVRSVTEFRDHARPLLVFSPSATDSRLREQSLALAPYTAGLREREVVVLTLDPHSSVQQAPSEASPAANPAADPAAGPPVWPYASLDAPALRRQYHVQPGEFTVVLVGKDGGEKQRWHAPVAYETLRDLIDSMPMRQDEMRRLSPVPQP